MNKNYHFSLILIFLFFIIFSCKKDNKNDNLKNRFIVTVRAKFLKDDIVELFFDSKDNPRFSAKQSIKKSINGSINYNQIDFVLEDNQYPNRIRLDLGQNRKQDKISITSIKIKYNKSTVIFDKRNMRKYFKPNKYIDFDFETLIAKCKIVDDKYDPYIESYNLSKFLNEMILY